MVLEEMQKAYNVSFLGQDFIDGCSAMKNVEGEALDFVDGSKDCTFSQFEKSHREYKECQNKAVDLKDRGMALINVGLFSDVKYDFDRS